MDSSTPGFPVLHHLPELTQTHVHWVGDVIQSSHPLSGVTRDWCMIKMAQGKWRRAERGMDWQFGIRRCKVLYAGWINSQALLHTTVQFSRSVLSNSATPWTAACQASLFFTNSLSLLKLMSIESVMLSNHLILCRPLLLLPSITLSIRVFSYESALHFRWSKYSSFSFSISPSNEYSGLISFQID